MAVTERDIKIAIITGVVFAMASLILTQLVKRVEGV